LGRDDPSQGAEALLPRLPPPRRPFLGDPPRWDPDPDLALKIAFVTPEFQSLVRRTNLAGVSEALSVALTEAGSDLRVFMPWVRELDLDALDDVRAISSVDVVDGPDATTRFDIHRGELKGVPVYLLSHPELFAGRNPYGNEDGPYSDNWRRYAAFGRAVLESLVEVDFTPDILHCMDWTTGLIPVVRELEYVERQPDHPASRAGTFFAIHNLAMQGTFEREILTKISIPHRYFKAIAGVEQGGKVNFLKSGAEFATIIGTHSPSHAQKIQERDRGYGLEETFQRRKKELVGITNGIDYHAWDPENDPLLPASFSASSSPNGKRRCKQALQSKLKLDNGPRTPLACTIGRWDADSGFDLVAEILTQILERNVEMVVMGSGQPDIQARLKTIEESFIGRFRVIDDYAPSVAHLMMGGADLLLLPSHYHPSNPLFAIAMRYGVAPMVYSQSGLEDVVTDCVEDPEAGTGFHFQPYNSDGLMTSINEFIKVYRNQTGWNALIQRCLAQDFSWKATAAEYLKAYRRVTRRVRGR